MSEPEWVVETQRALGALITKPTLKSDLLQKPPFRFLHHIVTSMLKNTNVPAGLFDDDQLRSKNVVEKAAKIRFLEKLVAFVQLASGRELDVLPTKIVAGLQADKTNVLLQQFAAVAGDDNVARNITQLVNKVRGMFGEEPVVDFSEQEAQAAAAAAEAADARLDADASAPADAFNDDTAIVGDVHANHQHVRMDIPPALNPALESCIERTQRMLGTLINQPELLQTRLLRPRFNFLHDIVMQVMRVTGFPEGLYEGDELVASRVPVRYKFVKKLIECVSLATNTNPPLRELVKGKNVAAGMAPERTNLLLQHFAVAAASGACSHQIVAHMRDVQIARSTGVAPANATKVVDTLGIPRSSMTQELQRVTFEVTTRADDAVEPLAAAAEAAPSSQTTTSSVTTRTVTHEQEHHRQQQQQQQQQVAPQQSTAASGRTPEQQSEYEEDQRRLAELHDAEHRRLRNEIAKLEREQLMAAPRPLSGKSKTAAPTTTTTTTTTTQQEQQQQQQASVSGGGYLGAPDEPMPLSPPTSNHAAMAAKASAAAAAAISSTEPVTASAWYDRALVQAGNGETRNAMDSLQKAITLSPTDPVYYYHRGVLFSELCQTDEALVDFNRAIELDPHDASYLDGRANCYCGQRRFPEAIIDYTEAIRLDPSQASYYNNRGLVYDEQGDLDGALSDYSTAIQLNSTVASVFYHRGVVLYEKNLVESAIKDFTRAIELSPTVALCYCNRGAALYEIGKYAEAINDYSTAIELSPHNAVYYNNRGAALYDMERFDEAIDDYSRAVELNPDDALCYANRGRLFYQQGQWDAAVADYTKAIALNPNDASFHNNRGYAYDKLGNLDAAIYDLTMATELAPKSQYKKKLAKLKGRNSHYG